MFARCEGGVEVKAVRGVRPGCRPIESYLAWYSCPLR